MHEAALARAALPAPTICLGMLLRPYSLGHELWLLREHSGMLRGSPDGLPAAVLICCQTWDELKAMRGDWFLGLKLWLWKKRVRKMDLAIETAKFVAYREEGLLSFPASEIINPDKPAGRTLGAPFILRLQQWLMVHFRLNEAQAWDYPIGLAIMRWQTYWESEGCFEVKNAGEAEFDAYVEQVKAAAKNGKPKESECQA